ncbi:MAG: 1-deoxy-D-xylulose-5-phosphate synthase [Nitrospirae bacterium]|nr:1-deoxy-D-xylulose-5-phosphate synthase [Nitrospirota bacterium]
MALLESINCPDDLKKLTIAEMEALAEEIRDLLIERVSINGGHLASNLGSVELTIALHHVFDSPRDRIIWDVGHQAYVHKILTGRRDLFHTIRREGGISGFPKRSESVHDAFDTGHSSTSISAALGMAEGKRNAGAAGDVIAVIGDGAMTSGLAFEGLNHAGHLGRKLIVILNDNDMSISPNVGALSGYLHRLMTGVFYNRVKKETKQILEGIPRVGESMLKMARRAEDTFKGLFAPGMLFEELGFEYVGPVDGHRVEALVETLHKVREFDWPTLVHVITKKGKGYEPAEKNPSRFHGIGPFDIETGEPQASASAVTTPALSKVFGDALTALAAQDARIVAVTAAMTAGTGLESFAKAFPRRFYDVGIAEPHAATFAAGLAAEGMRPVVAVYSTFLQRSYDEIIHDVCLQNLPVVFALDRAGIVGEDGPTHHGVFDLSYLRHIPNLMLMAPRDENELRRMLKTALDHIGPSAIRFPRGKALGPVADAAIEPIPGARAEVLREGGDVVICALGAVVKDAVAAAGILHGNGVEATVINARFVKPMDEELISGYVSRIGRIVTVEENAAQGGFGSAVAEMLIRRNIFNTKTAMVGIPDRFIEHGSRRSLLDKLGVSASGIAAEAERILM